MTLRWMTLALLVASLAPPVGAQNSRRKVRRPPGEQAARAGSAVRWRQGVAEARAESAKTGKPVFWYVPSIRRSPMDRKPEIDRYLMGGPFSWPAATALLNRDFVPVREVARGELAERHGLRRLEFIEPGYLVLDAEGEELLRAQQLTTFHPRAFLAPLERVAGQPAAPTGLPFDGIRPETAAAVREGAWQQVLALTAAAEDRQTAAQLWVRGVAQFRLGSRGRAEECWQTLAAAFPANPLAWKAALEVEGHGPFVRGFEVYGELPPDAVPASPSGGTRAAPGVYSEGDLWRRSVTFLVGACDEDGVFRDSTYDFGGTDGLPNVHAAVTCLVGEALLAASARSAPGLGAPLRERVEALLTKLRAKAARSDWLALSDRDEIVWARAYAVRFLRAWGRRRGADGEDLEAGLRRGVAALIALQPETGVWFHEYGNPFAIATALQALHGARAGGVTVPQENIDKGLRALAFNRTEQGAFSYGQTRPGRKPRASVEAAAGRMPLCELALYLFGVSDQERLLAAVESGVRHHDRLAEVRKYDDHANRLGYGGFFFWFDMLGRAEAIAELEDRGARRALAQGLRAQILALPEVDGCFVDSHELGRCYGTAMALLCLDTIARASR